MMLALMRVMSRIMRTTSKSLGKHPSMVMFAAATAENVTLPSAPIVRPAPAPVGLIGTSPSK